MLYSTGSVKGMCEGNTECLCGRLCNMEDKAPGVHRCAQWRVCPRVYRIPRVPCGCMAIQKCRAHIIYDYWTVSSAATFDHKSFDHVCTCAGRTNHG